MGLHEYESTNMNAIKNIIIATSIALSAAGAQAYTIDGDISDWGVTATGQASDWTPNVGVYSAVSDEGTWGLAPGAGGGGQAFDAEAIYLDYDSTYLYYAVVTGRQQSETSLPSGDIAFDFNNNGTSELGIETRGNNGYSTGDLVQVSSWSLGNPYPQSGVAEILSGSTQTNTDFAYSTTPTQNIGQFTTNGYEDHYIMEGRIALSEFSLYAGQNFTVHWTMGCGNDEIHLSPGFTIPNSGNSVPLPATSWMFGAALIGLVGLRRKQKMASKKT